MNIQVLEANNVLTMSSLEIAELTGKRHDNVMVDIVKMFKDLGDSEGFLKSEHTYTHPQNGQKYKCYSLPKEETICLIAGYKYNAAIDAMLGECWFLHQSQDSKYYFDRQENLTKMLQGISATAPEAQIDELICARLKEMFTPSRKTAYSQVIPLPRLNEVLAEVKRNRVLLIIDRAKPARLNRMVKLGSRQDASSSAPAKTCWTWLRKSALNSTTTSSHSKTGRTRA